jgi:hypothetical protein
MIEYPSLINPILLFIGKIKIAGKWDSMTLTVLFCYYDDG